MQSSLNNKKLCFILAAVAAITAAAPVRADEVEKPYHQVISAGRQTRLSVETVNGNINFKGVEGEDIVIDADITVKGRKESVCRDLLERVEISVIEKGDEISIEPDTPKKWGYSISISFDIALPARMGVKGGTVNGGLSADNIRGGFELSTVNGMVNASTCAGSVDCKTVNGTVNIEGLQSHKASDAVQIQTVNGNIEVECAAPPPMNLNIETVNGSSELKLSEVPDARLSIEVFNGNIILKGLPEIGDLKARKTFDAVLGKGTGKYKIESVNGNARVEIKKQP